MIKSNSSQRLLAIFAHPDDELFIAPILSRYARQGVDCYLAIVTDGRFGITRHMNGLAGDELAALRKEELHQSTHELGINDPVMLGFEDGFSHKTPELKRALKHISILFEKVQQLLLSLRPTALITFGPDGIYAHPDHTTVGNVVSTVYQQQKFEFSCQLYYPGFSKQLLSALAADDSSILSQGIYPLDEQHLPIKISFTKADADAARRSLSCHKSQFTIEQMDKILERMHSDQHVYFRPWNGKYHKSDSLF